MRQRPPTAPTDPIAFSFLLFRNYDGHGAAFGATSVSASSTDQGTVSAYAAQRAAHVLTLVLINKTGSPETVPVTVSNPAPTGRARFFCYSGADLSAIHTLAPVSFTNGLAEVPLPAWSMSVVEVRI